MAFPPRSRPGPDTVQATLKNVRPYTVGELPVIASFCRKIGIPDIIDRLCPSQASVASGTVVTAMVLDILSGRSPLYRVEDFWRQQDTELVLGEEIDASALNDDALGRTLDRIHEAGTMKIFTEISLAACRRFGVSLRDGSFDTTSVNVWGDYATSTPGGDAPHICHGYSKDRRPDLKQFTMSLLCVEGNIPIIGKVEDGNRPDCKANNEELQNLAAYLRGAGIARRDFLYIADCKLVDEKNLALLGSNPFITRLPASYGANREATLAAIGADDWTAIGKLNQTPDSTNRPAASYSYSEQEVTLYGGVYRAVVVRSSNLDKRKEKGLQRRIEKAGKTVKRRLKEIRRETYQCEGDATRALQKLREESASGYWKIDGEILERKTYARGRVAEGKERRVTARTWSIDPRHQENHDLIAGERQLAGHFILLTNVPAGGKGAPTGEEILRRYKAQHGIEQNFSFLKEPWIANDTFLKSPRRIESLGMLLLLSLLVWSLMQRALRRSLEEDTEGDLVLTNLDRRPTDRPTSFILVHKFKKVSILRHGALRVLAPSLNRDQHNYLRALDLGEEIFTVPPPRRTG